MGGNSFNVAAYVADAPAPESIGGGGETCQGVMGASGGVAEPSVGQTIGWAVKQLHNGSRVRRAGWNGKGMFLFLVPGSQFQVNRPPLLGIYPPGTTIDYCPHVDMRTADGKIVPWLCSQTDLLACDWELADTPDAVTA